MSNRRTGKPRARAASGSNEESNSGRPIASQRRQHDDRHDRQRQHLVAVESRGTCQTAAFRAAPAHRCKGSGKGSRAPSLRPAPLRPPPTHRCARAVTRRLSARSQAPPSHMQGSSRARWADPPAPLPMPPGRTSSRSCARQSSGDAVPRTSRPPGHNCHDRPCLQRVDHELVDEQLMHVFDEIPCEGRVAHWSCLCP